VLTSSLDRNPRATNEKSSSNRPFARLDPVGATSVSDEDHVRSYGFQSRAAADSIRDGPVSKRAAELLKSIDQRIELT